MSIAKKFSFLLIPACVLLASASPSASSEGRVNALGGNPIILSDGIVDVYTFPHELQNHANRMVLADVTLEYYAYFGQTYFFTMGRDRSRLDELDPTHPDDTASFDLGWANNGAGALLAVQIEDAGMRIIDISAKYSKDMGGRDVAAELEILNVEDGTTGFMINAYARQPINLMNGAFNLGTASFMFDNLGDDNGFPRVIALDGGVFHNDQVNRQTRLIYGISGGLSLVDGGDTTIGILTVGGIEHDVFSWCSLRASAVKPWSYVSPDQGDARLSNPDAFFAYGMGFKKGPVTLDVQFARDILRSNPLGGDSAYASHTSLIIDIP